MLVPVNVVTAVELIALSCINIDDCISSLVEKCCDSIVTDELSSNDGNKVDIVITPSVATGKGADVLMTAFVVDVDNNCSEDKN